MLTQSLLAFGALAFATFSSAKPLPSFKQFLAKRGHGSHHSFNKYSGFETMNNFDDFYGVDNFSGSHSTFHKDKEVVCTTGSVEIVQQYLTVLREYYKKIITEQICEVEVQTIVHQQFVSGCESFSNDIRRNGDCNEVTYDHDISCKIVNIHDESNNCVIKDWGWNGDVVGNHACSYSGDNWDSSSSPASVSSIYGYCQQSYGYSSPSYSSYWQSSYSPSYSYGSSYDSSYGSSYAPSYSYTHLAPPPSYTYGYSSGYTYDPPSYSYTYEPPSYTYSSYEPPSYTYSSYEAPSYTSYEAPSYTSNSYGYGSSYEPSYGSSYGYGSSYEPSSEYGSSYGSESSYEPSYGSGYSSPDVSIPSNVTVCDSCESSDSAPVPVPLSSNSTIPGDDSVPSSSDVAPTDDSVPSGTDVAPTSATDASSDSASPAPTDASSSSALATDATDSASIAATSVGSAGATIVNTGTAPAPAAASA